MSTTSTIKKVARSIAFRMSVVALYEEACALCGVALKAPSGAVEVDAAHVVPRSVFGVDDARNGFALCKRHHWAFDKGLFGVGDDRKVVVPSVVTDIAQNAGLLALRGKAIREAKDTAMLVHPNAFRWHLKNIVIS
jgi:putative restriction endonuclease